MQSKNVSVKVKRFSLFWTTFTLCAGQKGLETLTSPSKRSCLPMRGSQFIKGKAMCGTVDGRSHFCCRRTGSRCCVESKQRVEGSRGPNRTTRVHPELTLPFEMRYDNSKWQCLRPSRTPGQLSKRTTPCSRSGDGRLDWIRNRRLFLLRSGIAGISWRTRVFTRPVGMI